MFLDIYFVHRVLNGGLTVMEVIVTWTHLDLHTTKMEEVTLYMTGNSTLTLYCIYFIMNIVKPIFLVAQTGQVPTRPPMTRIRQLHQVARTTLDRYLKMKQMLEL